MPARLQTVQHKLASLPVVERLLRNKRFRYVSLVLMADVVGCVLVYLLIHNGGLSTWTANVAVSKGMAPIGLAFNSFALTGHLRPTREHATNWFACWLPSSLTNMVYLAMLISLLNVEGITARVVAGFTFFPIDYAVKKQFVFGKYGELTRFYATKAWANYKTSGLLIETEWRDPVSVYEVKLGLGAPEQLIIQGLLSTLFHGDHQGIPHKGFSYPAPFFLR